MKRLLFVLFVLVIFVTPSPAPKPETNSGDVFDGRFHRCLGGQTTMYSLPYDKADVRAILPADDFVEIYHVAGVGDGIWIEIWSNKIGMTGYIKYEDVLEVCK